MGLVHAVRPRSPTPASPGPLREPAGRTAGRGLHRQKPGPRGPGPGDSLGAGGVPARPEKARVGWRRDGQHPGRVSPKFARSADV